MYIFCVFHNAVFEVIFDESEYRISESGPDETHGALRVCLRLRDDGAQSADLGLTGDTTAPLIVDFIFTTHDGTATGTNVRT